MATSEELRTAIRILEVFKEQDPDITLPSMLAFLYTAEEDGRSNNQYHMEQRLDMSGATASRAAAHWYKWKRPRVPGQDLIYSEVDPEDRRYRILYLNKRGQDFLAKIKESVNHGNQSKG